MGQTWGWAMKLELQYLDHLDHNNHIHQLECYGQALMTSDPSLYHYSCLVEWSAASSHHKAEDIVPSEGAGMCLFAGTRSPWSVASELLPGLPSETC